MQTFISLLRGINVSGQKKIRMADLKSLYENLEFKEVSTYIQSGNVTFKSNEESPDLELAKKIEQAICQKYQFEVPVVVRNANEWKNVISANPFLKEKTIDVEKLYVTFLSKIPGKAALQSIHQFDFSPDRFIIIEKEVFLYIPEGYGETKLSNKFFENKLKVTATTRNWKTINKLFEIVTGDHF